MEKITGEEEEAEANYLELKKAKEAEVEAALRASFWAKFWLLGDEIVPCERVRMRSTTTRDRNLQCWGISLLDFLSFLQ